MTPLQFILRSLLLVGLIALAAYFLGDVIDHRWIDEQVRDSGTGGLLLFMAASILLMSIGLSRQLVALLAGYGFGFSTGLLLAMCAVIMACMLTYTVANRLLRSFLTGRFDTGIARIHHFISENTFMVTLLFRLLPLGSNWMVNVAAGATAVRGLPFFAGSALGYIPQMMVFALIGSGVRIGQDWQIALAVVLMVIALVIGIRLYRRYRRHDWPLQPTTGC